MRGTVDKLLRMSAPFWRTVGLAGCRVHRVNPGTYLTAALGDEEPALRAQALRAVGELGRQDLRPAALQALDDDHEACRFWGGWSAVLVGDRGAGLELLKASQCRTIAASWRGNQSSLSRLNLHLSARVWHGTVGRPEIPRIRFRVQPIRGAVLMARRLFLPAARKLAILSNVRMLFARLFSPQETSLHRWCSRSNQSLSARTSVSFGWSWTANTATTAMDLEWPANSRGQARTPCIEHASSLFSQMAQEAMQRPKMGHELGFGFSMKHGCSRHLSQSDSS